MPGRESASPVRPTPAEGIQTGQFNITDAAQQFVAERPGRRSVLVINHGSTPVYVGDSAVTALSGLRIAGFDGQGVVIPVDVALFGLVATGTQRISYMEIF